jgi:hypothetical protein
MVLAGRSEAKPGVSGTRIAAWFAGHLPQQLQSLKQKPDVLL